MTHLYKMMPSPVGDLKLVTTQTGLAAVLWPDDPVGRVRLGPLARADDHPILCTAEGELERYFAGRLTRFTVPLDGAGTAFQKAVWRALVSIPFGETRNYGQIAAQIGRPTASRAVGAANGRNPISIIVPCHRVIGFNGKLTGFAGGLGVKQQLLALEAMGPGLQLSA